MEKKKFVKEFVAGFPVFATILQWGPKGGQHAERRVYLDESGERCVMINGEPTTLELLKRIGDEVEVWF